MLDRFTTGIHRHNSTSSTCPVVVFEVIDVADPRLIHTLMYMAPQMLRSTEFRSVL